MLSAHKCYKVAHVGCLEMPDPGCVIEITENTQRKKWEDGALLYLQSLVGGALVIMGRDHTITLQSLGLNAMFTG